MKEKKHTDILAKHRQGEIKYAEGYGLILARKRKKENCKNISRHFNPNNFFSKKLCTKKKKKNTKKGEESKDKKETSQRQLKLTWTQSKMPLNHI